MKPTTIVYTSAAGHTARYAAMLAEATGLPLHRLEETKLPKDTPILFMGWLFAGNLKGYAKAAKRSGGEKKEPDAKTCRVGFFNAVVEGDGV